MTRSEITNKMVRGATAGLVATCTMSAVLALAKASGWLGEPPPRKLTRRVLDRFGFRVRGKKLDATTLVAHAGYGVATGILYAMIPGRRAPVMRGTVFGLGVWAASYMGWIPALGLMSRPKNDRPGRPTSMILAHLVFGATLGAVDRAARRHAACSTSPG